MISAEYLPAQNFSRTTSGNIPLASWQLDLSSLSPGLSSANAGVVETVRLMVVNTASPQRIKRNRCMTYPPFHHGCPTGPLDHKVADLPVFPLPRATPGTA